MDKDDFRIIGEFIAARRLEFLDFTEINHGLSEAETEELILYTKTLWKLFADWKAFLKGDTK